MNFKRLLKLVKLLHFNYAECNFIWLFHICINKFFTNSNLVNMLVCILDLLSKQIQNHYSQVNWQNIYSKHVLPMLYTIHSCWNAFDNEITYILIILVSKASQTFLCKYKYKYTIHPRYCWIVTHAIYSITQIE